MIRPTPKCAVSALALLVGAAPSLARTPDVPRLPAPVRRELGRGWEVRTVDSSADLDLDGRKDLLVVAVGKALPVDTSDGLPWNPNPWRLLVALRPPVRSPWKVVVDDSTLIPPPLSAFQSEPFNGLRTESGGFEVELCNLMIAGTWETSTSVLGFRWQQGTFVLTRWSRNDRNRGTGLSITTTLDLATGAAHEMIEPADTDTLGTRERSWAIPPQALSPLATLGDGLQYRPENLDPP